jgi:hypothetical protein
MVPGPHLRPNHAGFRLDPRLALAPWAVPCRLDADGFLTKRRTDSHAVVSQIARHEVGCKKERSSKFCWCAHPQYRSSCTRDEPMMDTASPHAAMHAVRDLFKMRLAAPLVAVLDGASELECFDVAGAGGRYPDSPCALRHLSGPPRWISKIVEA